jgi:hypothetical protein
MEFLLLRAAASGIKCGSLCGRTTQLESVLTFRRFFNKNLLTNLIEWPLSWRHNH